MTVFHIFVRYLMGSNVSNLDFEYNLLGDVIVQAIGKPGKDTVVPN